MTANVKSPQIVAIGERERHVDYYKSFHTPRAYYLEFDKLDEDGTVYRIKVVNPFPEIKRVIIPELTVENMAKAADQLGVDRNTKWTIEGHEGQFLLTPQEEAIANG
jgi:hypothetical protein